MTCALKRTTLLLICCLAGATLAQPAVAWGEEKPIVLKDKPGRAEVEQNCNSCHTLDYTLINAPFLNRQGWEGEVNKMISVYGAPVTASDAKTIVDYLITSYGVGG